MSQILKLKKRLGEAKTASEKQIVEGEIILLKKQVDEHIQSSSKEMSYGMRDWSIETILSKYSDGLETGTNELFIPDYQREYKWDNKTMSRFIESILLNFPIPYLYISNVDTDDDEFDGRVEIIDGSQRIRALYYFCTDQIPLTDLKEIKELTGFTFSDLSAGRQRRFQREALRFVELRGEVSESTRRDLFERINSGNKSLVPQEQRHGSDDATSLFYKDVIIECSESEIFGRVAPLSDKKRANADHRELVLRFFGYLNAMESYNGKVKPFLDNYLSSARDFNEDEIDKLKREFYIVMSFIDKNIKMGFRRTPNSTTTTRARYEALAVGAALALREEHDLVPEIPIESWITSDEFKKICGADAANNESNLRTRINYVKNKLQEKQ